MKLLKKILAVGVGAIALFYFVFAAYSIKVHTLYE